MKNLIIFLSFLFSLNIHSVELNAQCTLNPNMSITDDIFALRTQLFITSDKLKTLNDMVNINKTNKTYKSSHPNYVGHGSVRSFLDMLKTFIATPNFSGVLVYIAAYSTKDLNSTDPEFNYASKYDNVLLPIFVYTTKDPDGNITEGKSYYICDLDKQIFRTIDVKSNAGAAWYKNYNTNVKAEIAKSTLPNASNIKPSTLETTSLWYNGSSISDLYTSIDCQQNNNNQIQFINMHWGLYEKDIRFILASDGNSHILPTFNHLTLLFDIPYAQKMSASDMMTIRKKVDGAYDTGVPCPPADNCGNGINFNLMVK